jgi:hypothetical protein
LLFVLTAAPRLARAESTLAVAAREVAHEVGAVPPKALVVASPHTVLAPRGDELASRVASLVASALGGDARSTDAPLLLAPARVRAGAVKAGVLVYLDVRVESGELRVTADAYPVIPNGWDRVRSAPPPPSAHAYVRAFVSAEVRSYLPPIRIELAHLTKVHQDVGPILAMACGDLDGDGANDLVLVTRHAVVLGYLDAGHFVVVRRTLAPSIGRRAPVPFREPLATAVIAPEATSGALYVAWGDRTGGLLGPDLVPRGALAGLPVAAGNGVGCVLPDAGRGGFADALVGCMDGKPLASWTFHVPFPADTWTALELETGARLVAAREPSGALHLSLGRDSLVVNDVGAQVALVDLDQDGSPEVVTTAARGEDALVVSSLQKGALAQRLKWPAPAGIDAVAVCPAQENNAPSFVAAVGSEIWHVD